MKDWKHKNRRSRSETLGSDLVRQARDPELRLGDVPGSEHLLEQHLLDPTDPEIAELLEIIIEEQKAKQVLSDDPFHANYPSLGEVPGMSPGRIPLLAMTTGQVLSIERDSLTKNLIVLGPTGGGKTNIIRLIISCFLDAEDDQDEVTLIAFDRKGDLVDCASLAVNDRVLVLRWEELQLALLQPPPGMSEGSFINTIVELLSRHLSLMASRRLMIQSLHTLYAKPRPAGSWPSLGEWIDEIIGFKASGFRASQYREAVLFAILSVKISLGEVFDYEQSDFFEKVMNHSGCIVINTEGLAPEMASLLASLFVNYVYESRGTRRYESGSGHQVLFVLDDAMALVHDDHYQEASSGSNPLSTWAFMGRSRNIGFLVGVQNFSLVSPSLRNNADSLICTSSYGRDAKELGVYLNLNSEQAARLSTLRPGEAVIMVRSVWPYAVYGKIPLVP